MNRKEARHQIGKKIRVVDILLGTYIGELIDIIEEPKKPWRGVVKIIAIEHDSGNKDLAYIINETYEISSTKIEPLDSEESEQAAVDLKVVNDLLKKLKEYRLQRDTIDSFIHEVETEITKINPSLLKTDFLETDFEYCTIEKDNDFVYLRDNQSNQIMLEDCPFDFQIKVKGKWISVHYYEDMFFMDENEKLHQVKEGAQIRINKEQFDPYQLLLNELDKPALDSLNSGLKKYQMTHDDCVNCHNSLINQYLSSEEQKIFKGVNFISYQNDETTLIIQHHYERKISTTAKDEVTYDRFEMTNDLGTRLVMTYTTEKSK